MDHLAKNQSRAGGQDAGESSGQIAEFFRRHREAAGLSPEMVAKELGLNSTDELLAYENGTQRIPLDEIFALTNVLNISPEDVLTLIHDVYNQRSK